VKTGVALSAAIAVIVLAGAAVWYFNIDLQTIVDAAPRLRDLVDRNFATSLIALTLVVAIGLLSPLLYVISLRLMPALPFFVVCVLPALAGIPYRHYLTGSIIGSLPGLFLVAGVGAGLASLAESGGQVGMADLVTNTELIVLTLVSAIIFVVAAIWSLRRTRAQD